MFSEIFKLRVSFKAIIKLELIRDTILSIKNNDCASLKTNLLLIVFLTVNQKEFGRKKKL